MQRTRQKRPILSLKSSRAKSASRRNHNDSEEGFSQMEEGNFATEPRLKAGDQSKTRPGDPAQRAELQASQESETGIRQPGEQWSEGPYTEERFKEQVHQARENLREENRPHKRPRHQKREKPHKANLYRSHR